MLICLKLTGPRTYTIVKDLATTTATDNEKRQ